MKNTAKGILGRAGAACHRSRLCDRCVGAQGHRSARGLADRWHGPAFTLMELLVAVGALAFVAVGVAAIFEATGKTVRAGRRVSDFSAYANLIQQQMRADLASMTREGFLVIHHEYCDASGNGQIDFPGTAGGASQDDVALYDGDLRPRLRRNDELLFFAKGQFTSLREALHPDYVARADAAAIYYGHGERRINDAAINPSTSSYLTPQLDDNVGTGGSGGIDPDARLGYVPSGGVTNPNRYASDWILTRRVTLLRPARTGPQTAPSPTPFNLPNIRLRDSDTQIALQPAASNIFRGLSTVFPATLPPLVRNDPAHDRHPQLASGLVDIVTTDLAEVRMIVMTSFREPGAVGINFFDPLGNEPSLPDRRRTGVDGAYLWFGPGSTDLTLIGRQQRWMEDALPAWSTAAGPQANRRTRVRCEASPTDFVGQTDPNSPTFINQGQNNGLDRAFRRADQMMLSASNFLPHCTEFIVEWSFGQVYPSDPSDPNFVAGRAGEMIWHGMPRSVNGSLQSDYYIETDPLYRRTLPFQKVGGGMANRLVRMDLIHGQNFNVASQGAGDPLSSYFGYLDPTFNPENPLGNLTSTPNGLLDLPDESRYPTMPWAWPKLIRVTLSLSDPNDPSIEQSFQFVFDVPQSQP